MQIQPTTNNQLQQAASKKPLIEELSKGYNAVIVREHLGQFIQRGAVNFGEVLKISMQHRIPELTKTQEGRKDVLKALTGILGAFMNKLKLKYAMTNDDIVDLAVLIIDESHEDNLAIEDVLLFLQGMARFKYGDIEYKMDSVTFFKMFEKYRQERYLTIRRFREEEQASFKIMGRDNLRPSIHTTSDNDSGTLFSLMQTYYEEKNANKGE